MALTKTNFVIIASPLPEDFEGTPQEFFEALIKRMEIQSPSGTNFFVAGDVEPSTNLGPWLKGGKQWFVFSADVGGYIPLDISASTARLFTAADAEPDAPTSEDANIWLRTASGRVIAWYFWDGSAWRPGGNVPPSGATLDRPTGAKELEQFFDTDINALLHWERGAWRTVSGVPGDIKFVTAPILTNALASNPGWQYLGDVDQSYIGRVLGIAAKDTGATPESSFTTDSGITARAAGDATVGTETVVLTSLQIEQHTHLTGALTALNSGNTVDFYRVDDGETISAPTPRPPNYAEVNGEGSGAPSGTKTGEIPSPSAGTMTVTSRQLTLAGASAYTTAAEAHPNIQPTLFFWALTKQ